MLVLLNLTHIKLNTNLETLFVLICGTISIFKTSEVMFVIL